MTAEQRIGVFVLWDKIIHLSFVSLVPCLFFLFETISLFFHNDLKILGSSIPSASSSQVAGTTNLMTAAYVPFCYRK